MSDVCHDAVCFSKQHAKSLTAGKVAATQPNSMYSCLHLLLFPWRSRPAMTYMQALGTDTVRRCLLVASADE